MVKRGEVYWVDLDSTRGGEIRKTRPGLVISPDDMNQALPRIIIAPLTSKGQALGCRPEVLFLDRPARILLDQLHSVNKHRLGEKMGSIAIELWHPVLMEMLVLKTYWGTGQPTSSGEIGVCPVFMGCRPEVLFLGRPARILLDQLHSVNKQRLGEKMGSIAIELWHPVLMEMLV